MRGSPPFSSESLVSLASWQDGPQNRWAFQHVRELVPTARIRASSRPWRLVREPREVRDVQLGLPGGPRDVAEMLESTYTDGFCVLHHGHIVFEYYDNGLSEDTPHLLQSVSKSVTGALAGVLVGRGALDPRARLGDVLVELDDTSFSDASVQQLLDMRTGTRFNEDYDDPASDVRAFEEVYLWRPRSGAVVAEDALAYFASLSNDAEHGGAFRYRSVLTDVMAWVIERAGAARFAELVSRELWGPMGAEFDADVTLDAHGNAMADGGISACLRDLARLGLLYARRGRRGSRAVVPARWVDDTVKGASDSHDALRATMPSAGPAAHYRNFWWVDDARGPVLRAWGIYGQNIIVHAPSDTVLVKLSSQPTPSDMGAVASLNAAAAAIGRFLDS